MISDSRHRRLTYTDVTYARLTHNSTPFSADLNTQSVISSTYSPLSPTGTCDLHDEVGTLEAMRARLEWLQVYDPNEFNVQNRVFQVRVGEWMAKVGQP